MSDVLAVASDHRKVPVAVQVRPELPALTLYSSKTLINNYEQFHDKKEFLLSISAVIQD